MSSTSDALTAWNILTRTIIQFKMETPTLAQDPNLENFDRAMELGANAYLSKPYLEEDLLMLLKKYQSQS